MALGLYKRLSVYDGTSTSPERQEADGRNFADLHGEKVVKTYSDLDLSAYTALTGQRSRSCWPTPKRA